MLRGLHINNPDDTAAWQALTAARPALVKLVNPSAGHLARVKELTGAVTIARFTLDNVDLQPTANAAGERWWNATRDRVLAVAAHADWVEVPVNEAHNSPNALGLYAIATARYVELAAEWGVRCLVGNFARGCPEPGDWHLFAPALRAARAHGGALSLHYYFHRSAMDVPWQVGRGRLLTQAMPADTHLPIWVTEFGLDNGDRGYPRARAGWRDAGYANAAEYAADLDVAVAALDDGLHQGVCLFNLGDFANHAWRSFDADDPALVAWLAVGPRPSPAPVPVSSSPPPPGESPMPQHQSNPHGYTVGDGFLKKADELGWTLLSDEMYHDPQQPDADAGRSAWSEALCDKGRLYWHAALPVEGNVIAVPFA